MEFLGSGGVGIVGFVIELDEFLGVEFLHTEVAAFKASADGVGALLEAFFEFGKGFLTTFNFGYGVFWEHVVHKSPVKAFAFLTKRVLRNHDVKLLFHDIRVVDQATDVLNIFKGLFLEEGIRLGDTNFFEFFNIMVEVEFFTANEDLNRKLQAVEEVLVGVNNRILFGFGFEVEVDTRAFEHGAEATIFKNHSVVVDLCNFKVKLGAFLNVLFGVFDGRFEKGGHKA